MGLGSREPDRPLCLREQEGALQLCCNAMLLDVMFCRLASILDVAAGVYCVNQLAFVVLMALSPLPQIG